MSSTYAEPFARLRGCLDEIASVDPLYRTPAEKQEALVGLSQAITRAEAQRLRVLAVADDIAHVTGARSAADWLADRLRDAPGTVRRQRELALRLDGAWIEVQSALAAAEINLNQARVIVESLDKLPEALGDDLCAKAESFLIAKAAELSPRELRTLGGRLLEYLAPDIAEGEEHRRLLDEERRAEADTRLSFRCRGDGSTDLNGRVPDHVAGRLRGYLDSVSAPRRRHLRPGTEQDTVFGPLAPEGPLLPDADDEARHLPIERQRGLAFVTLLERLTSKDLPRHGGTATSIMVTLSYEGLLSETGVATTSTGHRVTAGTARRLACQAGILPIVLDGQSEILDVGRTRRLVTEAIRKALNLRDAGCTALGCTMPATFCEAHHIVPWSRGGRTSLKDCKLLCPFHHHRAHDPAWLVHHEPNGKTRFTRRT